MPKLLDQLWVQTAHTGLKHRLFARFLQDLVHLLAGLLHHLLDAGRVDAAIDNQLGQRDPGDLSPDGVEARKRYRFRRVIDDQVDARGLFERTDVSSLAADETTLHLIIGQRNGGDCGLCNYISSQALNGHYHVLAGIVVRFVLVLLLQLPVLAGKLVPRFVFGLPDYLVMGLRDRQTRGGLQLHQLLLLELLHFPVRRIQCLLAVGEPMLPILHGAEPALQVLFPVGQSALLLLDFAAPLPDPPGLRQSGPGGSPPWPPTAWSPFGDLRSPGPVEPFAQTPEAAYPKMRSGSRTSPSPLSPGPPGRKAEESQSIPTMTFRHLPFVQAVNAAPCLRALLIIGF